MEHKRHNSGGYTILEVIIVLTVSSLLFATAIFGFSTQNKRTQFTESVQTFSLNLQDILNDVETGFYPTGEALECSASATGKPVVTNPNVGGNEQGSNVGCTFIGKAIQLAPDGSPSKYEVFTVVGRQFISSSSQLASRLNEAEPVAIEFLSESRSLTSDVEIVSLKQPNGDAISLFAMVSDSGASGIVNSGLNTRTVLAGNKGSLGETRADFLADIEQLEQASITNGSNGLEICLREGNDPSGRTAIVSLGTNQSKITIDTKIDEPCT